MKGPYYDESDTLNDNPTYRMWIYAWKGNTLAWQDNGEFQSIPAGIVQETGNNENIVMSQKAVTENLNVINDNTGISEYPAFDPAKDYAVGDVVNYEGRLRRFVAEHAAGEWIGTDAEEWSERKEVAELASEINKTKSEYNIAEYTYNSDLVYDGTTVVFSSSDTKSVIISIEGNKIIGIEGAFNSVVFTDTYPIAGVTVLESESTWKGKYLVPITAKFVIITLHKNSKINIYTSQNYNLIETLKSCFSDIFAERGNEFLSLYKCPIYDLNVISDGGHDKIVLYSLYKSSERFMCAFTDENGLALCKYETNDLNKIKDTILIQCKPVGNSGVYIDVIINTILLENETRVYSINPVINKKQFFTSPIEYYKKNRWRIVY